MTSQLSWRDVIEKTTAMPPVAEIPKGTAVPSLSWQPPPVTKCYGCGFADHVWELCYAIGKHGIPEQAKLYRQNKDGITPTCPMYQQQNKEVK